MPILEAISKNGRLKNLNLSWNFLIQIGSAPQAGTYIKSELLDLGNALPSEMIKVEPPPKKKSKSKSPEKVNQVNIEDDQREKAQSKMSKDLITGWATLETDKVSELRQKKSRPNSYSSSGLSILKQSIGDQNLSIHNSTHSRPK